MKKSLVAITFIAMIAVAHAQKVVVAYVPNWIELETFTDTIDYGKVTHLNVAFENPADDAGNMTFNKKDDALIAKAHAKKVKVLVSIGGGSASTNKELMDRYFALLTEEKRAGFVAKLVEYVVSHSFDGLDVDIEGPSINTDYGAFVQDLGKALKLRGKLLTSALSKGYGGDKVPSSVFEWFDFVNIMAYDESGPWNPDRPGQHSSFDAAKQNVKYWLDRGLPKSKAVLGVPFYGYGFGDAYRKGDYPFSEIVTTYPGAEKADQVGSTIWYNGLATIQAKAKYVVDEKLAGIMIWSLDSDAKGEKSLLAALWAILNP
ncbi:glycosyl hydrolase family 18 protein [Fimbriimonas ginsengisoli]|uniref:chitinase n=1 Tax=Fimbriimonas ginsengisoli Gsoil 348 TaxID=661478 RepID=A0A068NLF2_FIMGI|nr:glycosyl hydrolase family 18 protein [Fimbriimonas ginsengisoli]AIE84403.1 glycoside hydrolase family protein [Fimbriimonas ginsengisoli Gsoil 348]